MILHLAGILRWPGASPPGQPTSYSSLTWQNASQGVKANARERVGQPKPARVLDTEPRTGREVKHKPKLEEMIRQEE